MSRRLGDFGTLSFDVYGTLIDWETGIWDALQPLIMANGREDIVRADALAGFARFESAQQAATPGLVYPELLAEVHRALARHHGLETGEALDAAFARSVPHWPAFADTADALRRLKRRYRLVVLSNVDRAGLAASCRKLGVAFDAAYTAEDMGAYKPAARTFEYLLAQLEADLGVGRNEVLHTAQSLFHDHVQARAFGLANAWIDRQGQSAGGDWGATAEVAERPATDFLFPTLAAMADAAEAGEGA